MSEDYDAAVADFRRDLLDTADKTEVNNGPISPAKDIDEEIKVTKKRKPTLKLDDELLLSQKGIPTLRKRARRLKFGGKGNEYVDIQTLLEMYQDWMDGLYPKAKFRDSAMMIEKLGHSKRMNVSRRAWMQETRPQQTIEDEERRGAEREAESHDVEQTDEQSTTLDQPATNGDHIPEDDELDMLLNDEAELIPVSRPAVQKHIDVPPEDELDAILAEEAEMFG